MAITRQHSLAVALVALVALMIVSPMAFAGGATASPQGMIGVPDGNVDSDLPDRTPMSEGAQAIEDAGVMAEDHAETLEVTVTSPGRAKQLTDGAVFGSGPIAITLTDDVNDEGRTVALPATEIRDILGHQPKMVWGTHEDGSTWKRTIEYQDGWLLVEIPHFSTNTVTFEGVFNMNGTFQDGSTNSYNLENYNSTSDVAVNMTGKENTETDSSTYQTSDLNDTFTVSGNAPGDATLSLTGLNQESYFNGPTSDQEEAKKVLEVNTSREVDFQFDYSLYAETKDTSNGHITAFLIKKYDSSSGENITIENIDVVADYTDNDVTDEGWHNFTSDLDSGDYVHAGFDGLGSGEDYKGEGDYESYYSYPEDTGETDVDFADNGPTTTTLSEGETWETTAEDLSPGDYDISINTQATDVDAQLEIEEKTQTKDPGVELNQDNWANHTGTLTAGETSTQTIEQSALQEGTNTYNISMPGLSSDAPPMQVEANISHTTEDDKTIDYDAEKFTERYNISKTYGSERSDVTMTIPFADTAVKMRTLEYRLNGGSWQTLSDHSIENTTLEANLPDVSAEDTIDIRANASKINVENADIQVTDPTPIDEDLDTEIDIASKSSGDVRINFPDNSRTRYANDVTYSTEDYYHVDMSGADLVLPAAGQGDSLRVSSIPIQAYPQTNDVEIAVPNPKNTEPEFKVRPGEFGGDGVSFTFDEAADGESYILWSITNDVIRDSGTASSPLTLLDDDSKETLQFQIDDSPTPSSSGDDNDDATLGPVTTETSPLPTETPPIPEDLLLYGGIGLAGVVGLLYWRGGSEAVESAGKTTASATTSILGPLGTALRKTIEYFRAQPYAGGAALGLLSLVALGTGFVSLPPGLATYVVIAGVPIVAYWALVRKLGASMLVWTGTSIGAILVGLQLLGTDVLETLVGWEGSILLLLGGLFLLRQYTQASRQPDEVNNITIRGNEK